MTASTDSSRALVDTNILVYAYDLDDPSKHAIARGLLELLSNRRRLVFSTQVFNEFCSVMMRPSRTSPFSPVVLVEVIRASEKRATHNRAKLQASWSAAEKLTEIRPWRLGPRRVTMDCLSR